MSGFIGSVTGFSRCSVRSNGFHMYLGSDSSAECYLHAMDEHEGGPPESPATRDGHDISDMDSELIEIPLNTVPTIDTSNTGELSDCKLGQCHGLQMIIILISNTRDGLTEG